MGTALAFILLTACTTASAVTAGADVPYGVGEWPEALGNHRAVLRVEKAADAVHVRIPWRRLDAQPELKDIQVVAAGETKPLANRVVLQCAAEFGELLFEAKRPGDYHVYYMPYHPKRQLGFGSEAYTKPEDTVDAKWRDKNVEKFQKSPGRLGHAEVVEIQARGEWNRLDPMEVPGTRAETEVLLAQHPQAAFLLFPEDRKNPIRMRDALPLKWIRDGVHTEFRGEAQRNEYFTFQLGLFAARQPLSELRVEFSDLTAAAGASIPASALRCFNMGGTDWTGRVFTKKVDVPQGQVQPLWIGVDVPEGAAPGEYAGSVAVRAADAEPVTVKMLLTVTSEVLGDRGDSDLWRHARLRWLDSTIGLDDEIVAPYIPLDIRGNRVACLNREVALGADGLPSGIRSGGNEVLAKPMSFSVVTDTGPVAWTASKGAPDFVRRTPGKAEWETDIAGDGFTAKVSCRMEFDGYLNFAIALTATGAARVQDVRLAVPMRREIATYMMGMGRKGGYRPESWDWHWDSTKHQDAVWLGDVTAGLQFKLKGPNYSWPLVNIHYKRKPLDIPDAWNNGGKGGCRMQAEGDAVVITAYSGPRALAAGETLQFNAGMLVTPVKPVDYAAHWATRYYHACKPVAEAAASGATVINIHQGNEINPYINYPFLKTDKMAAYAKEAHEAGMKLKIYYTLREISNHMAELWAVRSLGTEVFADGPGGGYSWLQEHLHTGYIPAWQEFLKDGGVDASIITQGLSRWHNYYLEGLDFLVRRAGIDGLYMDDIGFDREVMQRARKIMDRAKPGCLADLHSWNHFNDIAGFANCANLYMEHMPYIDSLWFGEGFDYNETPDYWLVEISGIPFGVMSEMLQDGGNPWRGMVYGMTTRFPYSGDPRPLWKLWDEFGIQDSLMIGYLDAACPVKTGQKDVLATVYRKKDATLVAVASWAKEPVAARLAIDWKALGLTGEEATLHAPEIEGFQSTADFAPDDAVPIAPGKGLLLVLSEKK
jgi:hypothetical protein